MRVLLVACAALAATAAFAADAGRHVDFTQGIVVDGVPVVDDFLCPFPVDPATGRVTGPRPCQTTMTVGSFAYFSLRRPVQGQSWADAIKRDDLAKAVRTAKDFPLLDDQLTTIETAMTPGAPAGMLGAVARIIDPKEPPGK